MSAAEPSEWFKDKLQQWQKDLQAWHVKHVDFKDPAKKAVLGTSSSKAAGPPGGTAGAISKAKAPEPKAAGVVSQAAGAKPADGDATASKDPLQKIIDEMEKDDVDIFGVDDVCDMKDESGTPLFSKFAFEDWALLSLRFELHLLVHAVRKDSKDDKTGIAPGDLASQYTKYFKKSLNPKNYGVESVNDILELVKDTAITGMRSKVVEPMVTDELLSNGIFVKLTEESRRERKRHIDSGDESRQLKFPRPTAPGAGDNGTANGGSPMGAPPMGMGNVVPAKMGPGGAQPPPFSKSGPMPGMPQMGGPMGGQMPPFSKSPAPMVAMSAAVGKGGMPGMPGGMPGMPGGMPGMPMPGGAPVVAAAASKSKSAGMPMPAWSDPAATSKSAAPPPFKAGPPGGFMGDMSGKGGKDTGGKGDGKGGGGGWQSSGGWQDSSGGGWQDNGSSGGWQSGGGWQDNSGGKGDSGDSKGGKDMGGKGDAKGDGKGGKKGGKPFGMPGNMNANSW